MPPASPAERQGLRVRKAREADAPSIAGLLAELGYATSDAAARHRVGEALEDPASELLVAVRGQRVLGFASATVLPCFPTGDLLRITALCVATSARRQGVGSNLIETLIERGKARRVSSLEVTTANARTGAHAFYTSRGFARTSLRFLRAARG